MADPKCPDCGAEGLDHIRSEDSSQHSQGGDAWFNIAFCDGCGHVYGVFAKHVLSHNVPLQIPPIKLPSNY